MKFLNLRRPSDPNSPHRPPEQTRSPSNNPPHGITLPASPVVVLNALGYIGFKVISTCGQCQVQYFLAIK